MSSQSQPSVALNKVVALLIAVAAAGAGTTAAVASGWTCAGGGLALSPGSWGSITGAA